MSTKMQTTKNIDLTYKLMSFLLHAKDVPLLPDNISFVPFSKKDKELNKANEALLHSITNEGKPVVKAEELNEKNNEWKITPINVSI